MILGIKVFNPTDLYYMVLFYSYLDRWLLINKLLLPPNWLKYTVARRESRIEHAI